MAGDYLVAELVEATHRIAELERKLDSMFRPGRVADRKYDEEAKRWHVRLRVGGTDEEPVLGPWVPYSQIAFGEGSLNVHYVPKIGSQMISMAPAGDYQQAVAVPLTWWNDHPAPSKDADEVVLTHGKIKVVLKGNKVTVEADDVEWTVKNKVATKSSEVAFDLDKELVAKAGDKQLAVTKQRIETVGKTYLGLDDRGEDAPKSKVDPDRSAKQVFAKV